MSVSAFVLIDAILPIGNHTISEYLPPKSPWSPASSTTLTTEKSTVRALCPTAVSTIKCAPPATNEISTEAGELPRSN